MRLQVEHVTKIDMLRVGPSRGADIDGEPTTADAVRLLVPERPAGGDGGLVLGGPLYRETPQDVEVIPPRRAPDEREVVLYLQNGVLYGDIDIDVHERVVAREINLDDLKIIVFCYAWPTVTAEDLRADVYSRASVFAGATIV